MAELTDDETRRLLAQQEMRFLLREELPGIVADGIKAAITKDAAREFAQTFIEVMKEQASVRVDTWAGSVVKGFAKKMWDNIWLVFFAVAFIYSVGGFSAVLAFGKWAIQEALR